MTKEEVEQGRVCAVLSYVLLGIIWYYLDTKMKKNNFVRYHVKQSIGLLIFAITIAIISLILIWVPVIGNVFNIVAKLAIAVLLVIGIVFAIQGKEKELPIIGQFFRKLEI